MNCGAGKVPVDPVAAACSPRWSARLETRRTLTGSEMQQARDSRWVESVAVVRNHEDGNAECAWGRASRGFGLGCELTMSTSVERHTSERIPGEEGSLPRARSFECALKKRQVHEGLRVELETGPRAELSHNALEARPVTVEGHEGCREEPIRPAMRWFVERSLADGSGP